MVQRMMLRQTELTRRLRMDVAQDTAAGSAVCAKLQWRSYKIADREFVVAQERNIKLGGTKFLTPAASESRKASMEGQGVVACTGDLREGLTMINRVWRFRVRWCGGPQIPWRLRSLAGD